MPAYASGPRAAMKPSGTPTMRNSTHASRRARARFGSLRLGPRGSVQAGRGRLREPAMRTPSTRMGIDKDDGESIRNDKRPPRAVRTCGAVPKRAERIPFLRNREVKRLSHLRSYLLTATKKSRGFPQDQGVGGACKLCVHVESGMSRSLSFSPCSSPEV